MLLRGYSYIMTSLVSIMITTSTLIHFSRFRQLASRMPYLTIALPESPHPTPPPVAYPTHDVAGVCPFTGAAKMNSSQRVLKHEEHRRYINSPGLGGCCPHYFLISGYATRLILCSSSVKTKKSKITVGHTSDKYASLLITRYHFPIIFSQYISNL